MKIVSDEVLKDIRKDMAPVIFEILEKILWKEKNDAIYKSIQEKIFNILKEHCEVISDVKTVCDYFTVPSDFLKKKEFEGTHTLTTYLNAFNTVQGPYAIFDRLTDILVEIDCEKSLEAGISEL